MTAKHTPGKWTVNDDDDYQVDAADGSVESIAYCGEATVGKNWSGTDYSTADHKRANARLIAAAPTMLDALQAAKHRLADYWDVAEFDQVCAAIEIATGEPA